MLKDILDESWTFRELKQEAEREGEQKGLQQGLQAQRQSLILLIQRQYPDLLQLARDVCNAIQTLEELQELFEKVLYAKDELEVHKLLLCAQK